MADIEDAANNPAGRVLWFLRELSRRNVSPARDQHLMDSVTLVLGTDVDSVETYRAVSLTREQAELVPEEMAAHSDIPGYAPICKHYDEILTAASRIQLPRNHILKHVIDPITPAGWASLEFADEVLRGPSVEKRLTASQTAEYLDQVQALISEVAGDDTLSRPDRERIVRLLRQVEDALVNIRIFGANYVEEAAVTVAGVVQVEKDLWDRVADKKWFKRFGTVLMGLLATLGAAGGIPAIEAAISDTPTEVVVVGTHPNGFARPVSDGAVDTDVVDGEIVEETGT